MHNFWDKDLTEDETETMLQKAADEISKRKLHVPAILALEMHKPVAYVGGHAALAMAPFMVPFLGFDAVNNYSRLFSKRENLERLIVMLEERAGSRKDQ